MNQTPHVCNVKLGECLEAYREKNNLTWRSLADEIGVDHAVLFKLRTKPTAGSENAMKIINWLMSQDNNHATRTEDNRGAGDTR